MNIEIVPFCYGDHYHIAVLEEPDYDKGDQWYVNAYRDVDQWCERTFGTQDLWGEEPVTGWKRMRNRYFFVQESKLTMFLLRWS